MEGKSTHFFDRFHLNLARYEIETYCINCSISPRHEADAPKRNEISFNLRLADVITVDFKFKDRLKIAVAAGFPSTKLDNNSRTGLHPKEVAA